MNKRACLYFKYKHEIPEFLRNNRVEFLQFTNKYRVCLFAEDSFFESTSEFINWFQNKAIISVHEVFSQYLTYLPETLASISDPIVESRTLDYWVHDIDIWISFPEALHEKIKSVGPHVYLYPDLKTLALTW